jgi:enoyl-CoA hydratase
MSPGVVLTGNRTVFSAGVDLLRLLDEGVEYLSTFLPALTTMFETVFFHPQPVVAAVNGHAIAGGCVIACAADHRLMAKEAGRIGVPELLVGVAFPTIALEIMRAAAHPQHFGVDLRRHHLRPGCGRARPASEVVSRRICGPRVAAAETLVAVPADVFALTKKQIRQPVAERVKRARTDFEPTVHAIWTSPATREAIHRYVSRTFRKPGGSPTVPDSSGPYRVRHA